MGKTTRALYDLIKGGYTMKKYEWVVYFVDGYSCCEYAFTAEQAKILAQAMRIRSASPYEVEKVVKHD